MISIDEYNKIGWLTIKGEVWRERLIKGHFLGKFLEKHLTNPHSNLEFKKNIKAIKCQVRKREILILKGQQRENKEMWSKKEILILEHQVKEIELVFSLKILEMLRSLV